MANGFITPPRTQQQIPAQEIRICYQMTTRNKSFLEMHYYLKKKGIKNNAFMLQLLDPDLAGIDPHDPMLSRTMKMKVQRECMFNFWYYVREVVRVTHSGSPKGIPFMLHRGNMAMFFCMLQNINTFIELPRQQGKTLGACVFYSWAYNFGTANSELRFMNKDLAGSKDNLAKVKEIIGMLPSYLQMTREYTMVGDRKKKATANVETIAHVINHNKIRTVASARSRNAAGNLLRGKTITFWWMDEWAFIGYNDAIYLSTYPALKTAFDNARAANKPYGILITTTPGILSTTEGKYAFEMKEDASEFSETWYDKAPMQIRSILDANQKSDFVYIRFSYKQLGRDEQWFFEICKGLQWKMRDIRREVLLEWTDMPENCPFSPEDLEDIEKKVNEPINRIEFFDRYILNVYKPIPLRSDYVPKYPPIIGVDVSGGYRRDASAITVIDSRTTEVIADFNSNHISPIDLARLVLDITCRFYPNAVINVERNGGFGASVIAKLKESKVKKNLYFEMKDRVVEEQTDGIRIRKKKMLTKVFGLDSTKDVRELLIEILRERVQYHKDKFNSPTILNEMKRMEIKRTGKVEHSDNSHDDQVFSYLMALYVWYEGKNLRENFHIEKQSIKVEEGVDDTITALDQKYTSVIDEVVGPAATPEEDARNEEVNQMLSELKKGQGILFNEFAKRRDEEEDRMFKMLLRSKPVLKSYCKEHNISEEEAREEAFGGETDIPDSVFTGFNSDVEMDQANKLKRNFNMLNFPTGR
jgi:hypothetical protein